MSGPEVPPVDAPVLADPRFGGGVLMRFDCGGIFDLTEPHGKPVAVVDTCDAELDARLETLFAASVGMHALLSAFVETSPFRTGRVEFLQGLARRILAEAEGRA